MQRRLATGRIVWAEIADANGIRKLRPAVIVTPTERLTGAVPFDVVAVTSRLPNPLHEDHVLLPWHSDGHPRTRLNRRCAAVCSWLAQVVDGDIEDIAGIVPSAVMATILAKIAAKSVPPTSPADAGTAPPNGSLGTPPDGPTS